MPTLQIWIEDAVYARLIKATEGIKKEGREKPINTYIREAIIDRLNREGGVPVKPAASKAAGLAS